MNVRDLLFRRDDGSEVHVALWGDGRATMSERPGEGQVPIRVWGPRLEPDSDSGAYVPLSANDVDARIECVGVTGPNCIWCHEGGRHIHAVLPHTGPWKDPEER